VTLKWMMCGGRPWRYRCAVKLRDMVGAEDTMPDLAELEHYCVEAREILARAEATLDCLGRNGACEGHLMMAKQGLTALRHLSRIIDRHRTRLTFEALPNAVSPPTPQKWTWRPLLRQRPADEGWFARTTA
jgi:hypothetical protein